MMFTVAATAQGPQERCPVAEIPLGVIVDRRNEQFKVRVVAHEFWPTRRLIWGAACAASS